MSTELTLYIALFLPLVGFFALVLFGDKLNRLWTGVIGSGAVGLSFLYFVYLVTGDIRGDWEFLNPTLYPWIQIPGIETGFSLYVDSLSFLMTLIITGIGFLILVYSNGYMEGDPDYVRFFAFMNLFVFAMLLLVLSGNLLVLFVGWEGVGLASYLLIGFWYERPKAAGAAVKAFVVNRVGDLGFLLGLLLAYYLFGTADIASILSRGQEVSQTALTVLTGLLFIGAIGKSAQIPLHTWLPDAMEGPTPVSALIHAATMVTAGVFLIVRLHPLFLLTPLTMQVVGVIGGVTSLFAALAAIGQMDLKRVLAYSTVSQLGLMFLACGAGAFYSAMFHLTTHAFVKGLLFLAAGNVVHRMHGETDMSKMGGLWRVFPITHWLFLIGVLAMSGIPPLAIFFSKDLILEQEYLTGFDFLFYLALSASILTAFYLARAYSLTFLGKSKEDSEIREASPVMLIPVSILAFLSITGGVLGLTYGKAPLLEHFIDEVGLSAAERTLSHGFMLSSETAAIIIGAFSGIFLAFWLYTKTCLRTKPPLPILAKGFYFNEIYDRLFVRPLYALSGWITNFWEPKVFEGSIWSATFLVGKFSRALQILQSGQIRSYVAWLMVGGAFLLIYFKV